MNCKYCSDKDPRDICTLCGRNIDPKTFADMVRFTLHEPQRSDCPCLVCSRQREVKR